MDGRIIGFDAMPPPTREDLATAYLEAVEGGGEIFCRHHGCVSADVPDVLETLSGLADPLAFRVSRLPLSSVTSRKATSPSVVARYAARLLGGEAPPPVLVRADGRGGWRVVEGGHRHGGALAAGADAIDAVDVTAFLAMDWDAWWSGEERDDFPTLSALAREAAAAAPRR